MRAVSKLFYKFCNSQMLPQNILPLEPIHFQVVKPAYIKLERDQFTLSLDLLKSLDDSSDPTSLYDSFELKLDTQMTVTIFQEYVKSVIPTISNLTLYTLDKSPIASVTKLDEIISEPFYMVTSNGNLFHIKLFEGYDNDDYSYMKQYLEQTGVPLLERKPIMQYLVRLDSLLEQNNKTTFFKNNSNFRTIDHNQLVRCILDSFLDMRNTQSDQEEDLYQAYLRLKTQKQELQAQRAILMEAAKQRASVQMLGGLLVLCGHFCFMGAGIYVYYDWDVMEPIGYFLNTGGMIYLSYQYFKLEGEWSHSKFSSYLIQKNYYKLCSQSGFNDEDLDKIEDQIGLVQDRLKTDIVTKL